MQTPVRFSNFGVNSPERQVGLNFRYHRTRKMRKETDRPKIEETKNTPRKNRQPLFRTCCRAAGLCPLFIPPVTPNLPQKNAYAFAQMEWHLLVYEVHLNNSSVGRFYHELLFCFIKYKRSYLYRGTLNMHI